MSEFGIAPMYWIRRLSKYALCQPLLLILLVGAAAAQELRSIDTANSRLVVHVFKSGIFSGFADNHEVNAVISEGSIDEGSSRVKFTVEARQMRVVDPKLQLDKRRQVQDRMVGPEVLDVSRFPQITFESTNIEKLRKDQFRVTGQLSLHGVTRQIAVDVRSENGRFLGTCTLKQRDFGITPITVAAGTVKVKDELEIEFDILPSLAAPGKD